MREEWWELQQRLRQLKREREEDGEDRVNRSNVRRITELRSRDLIPFGEEYIVDAGRWIRKPKSHTSMEDAIRDTAEFYRRDLWTQQPVYVAFFCEKEAIADLVYQETSEYDVPLAVIRGDSSKTFLWQQAKVIEREGKPAILYFLGDYDKKGRQIIESAVERIRRYAPDADIDYTVLAINKWQIKEYKLPTRPEKTNRRQRAVEIDALPPEVLRALIRNAIEQHIPQHQLDVIRAGEESERELGLKIADNLPMVKQYLSTMVDKEPDGDED